MNIRSAFALVGAVAIATNVASAQITITVGNAVVAPGGVATFEVTLNGVAASGAKANNAQLDIVFSTTAFNVTSAPSVCTLDPRLAALPHTESLPTSPNPGPGNKRLRLNIIDTTAPLGDVTDGRLYTCSFPVQGDAVAGSVTLTATRHLVGNTDGNTLPSVTVSGMVTIVPPSTLSPTRSPSVSPTRTVTPSRTYTPSPTRTNTPTLSPTRSNTPTKTLTRTRTATHTPTASRTPDNLLSPNCVYAAVYTEDEEASIGSVSVIGGTLTRSIALSGCPLAQCRPYKLVLDPDRRRAYVATISSEDARRNTVAVIDLRSQQVERFIEIAGDPVGITLSPNGRRLYVSETVFDSLIIIDVSSYQVIDTVRIGDYPGAVAATASSVYVARPYDSSEDSERGKVVVVDANTLRVVDAIPVGSGVNTLALTNDRSRLLAGSEDESSVAVINTNTNLITTTITNVPDVVALAVATDGAFGFAAGGRKLTSLNLGTARAFQSLVIGGHPEDIELIPGDGIALIADSAGPITIIDVADNSIRGRLNIPAYDLAIAPFPCASVPTTPVPACIGDCNGDHEVFGNEVTVAINIVAGNADLGICQNADADGDGEVFGNEVTIAINRVANGCPQ